MKQLLLLLLPGLALPVFAGERAQISVQWEWIRLPHAAANSLIREMLTSSTDAGAVHEAALAMVKRKEAVRLDFQGLALEDGERARLDSAVEKSYPTEFSSPQVSQSLTVQGPNPLIPLAPAVPSSFTFRKLGRTAEVDASLTDDGQRIHLLFAPVWSEHLGDLSYGQGVAEVQQPLFYDARSEVDLQMTSGVWQLAGLFTPPPEPQKEVKPELAPLPGDRVMLFVRASAPGLPGQPPKPRPGEPDQVAVLAEWIELDTAAAAERMLETPDASSAAAARKAVEASLSAGQARLVETVLVPCTLEQRAKILSVREVPCPTNFDAPQMPQSLTLKGPPPAGVAAGTYAPWITPCLNNSYMFRSSGVTMEVGCRVADGGDTITLAIAPELTTYLGREAFGLGPSMGSQARFQYLKSAAEVSLRPGTPALLSVLDAVPAAGGPPGSTPGRKVLLFVSIIH